MAMAACYSNYDLSGSQGVTQHHHQHLTHTNHQTTRIATIQSQPQQQQAAPQKDYSIPLHVDCSVEYELPNQAKPPAGTRVEPLLMIHPCYFRKMESQRRSPFINNMPNSSTTSSTSASVSRSHNSSNTTNVGVVGPINTSSTHLTVSHRRSSRNSQIIAAQQQQQQQQQQVQQQHRQQHQQHHQQQLHQQLAQQIQQQQITQMSQQAHYPVVSSGQQQQQQHQPVHQTNNTTSSSSNNQYNIEPTRQTAAVIHNHNSNHNLNLNHSHTQSQQQQQQTQVQQQTVVQHRHQQQQQQTQVQQQQQQQQQAAVTSWDQLAAAAAVATSMNGLVGIPGTVNVTGQSMYSKPVGKRDAMLSGGCGLYSNNLDGGSLNSSGRWEPDRSPMAAIPRDYQSGPSDTLASALVTTSSSQTTQSQNNVVVQQQQQQQQQQLQQQQQTQHLRDEKQHILSGKYRQYLRQHRLHPYMMTSAVTSFPHQLTATGFSQMQQVSCYNV